jgi:RecB family endonuclease NucS
MGEYLTVLTEQLLSPSPEKTLAFLRHHLNQRQCLLQLVGECEVSYTGRAQSTAEAGDYLLTLKPDGCLLVHGAKGVKPRNWQPTTDRTRATLEDGLVVVTGERFSPPEVVSMRVLSCFTLQAFTLRTDTGFVLSGSEADMQRTLREHLDLIEPGLCLIDHELPTGVGSVDLFARDIHGSLVVIELKRGKATHDGVHQLARYVHKVQARQTGAKRVRGILVAPDATGPALKQLEAEGLEFKLLTALPELKHNNPQTSLF